MAQDVKKRLQTLIDAFLTGELSFDAFEKAYSKCFIDEADAVLSPPDLEYYGEIHERAELTARDPPLEDRRYGWKSVSDFTKWLAEARRMAPE